MGVACVFFVLRKQQSRAKALFRQPWAVGLGLLLALGFLSLGFRFGLTLFRASAWASSFLGFRLSFKLAFASFKVLGWVYSVFIMGFLSLGFGLALLLLGLRPGFDRFWGFDFLSSLPFPSFRVSVSEYSFFSVGSSFIRVSVWVYSLLWAFFHQGFGLALLLLGLRPGFDRF